MGYIKPRLGLLVCPSEVDAVHFMEKRTSSSNVFLCMTVAESTVTSTTAGAGEVRIYLGTLALEEDCLTHL
jgi:hypothetical protein